MKADIDSIILDKKAPYQAKQGDTLNDIESDYTRGIYQAYRAQYDKNISIPATSGKINALLSKSNAEDVLKAIEQEKPQIPFEQWLDKKLSIIAKDGIENE